MKEPILINSNDVNKETSNDFILTSAYNFVPTGRYIYYPQWDKNASYDYPIENGMDGTIEVGITNVSPLFIRNGSENCDASEEFSCHIKEEGGKVKYFLPGSSLRGLWRSTVEALSFSEMKQFSDTIVSYRDFVDENKKDTEFIIKARESRAGWLSYRGGKWILYPCKGNYLRISMKEINDFCGGSDINEKNENNKPKRLLSWDRNHYLEEIKGEMYPLYMREGKEYRIVCTGIKHINYSKKLGSHQFKRREYLFPTEREEGIELDKNFMEIDFFKIHGQEKGFREYKKRLYNKEKDVAVFFQTDENGKVYVIGMSRINKMRRKYSPKSLLDKNIANRNDNRYDMASLLFGFSGKRKLRGKVQVGNALCTTLDYLPVGKEPRRDILQMPRPTYNPLYIQQSAGQDRYNTYDDDDSVLAGRKLYRIHKGSQIIERYNEPKNTRKNPTRETRHYPFYPIMPGHFFKCKLNLHNMCPIEIGALLTAITLFGDKDAYHNIGMAKSLGCGKIKTEILSINLSDNIEGDKEYPIKYFIKEYERAMSIFTYSHADLYDSNGNEPLMWAETPTVKRFLGIKHEHPIDEVKQMTGLAYRVVRKKENFQILTEPDIPNLSLLTEKDKEDIIKQATHTPY